jgi:DNA-binding beta-propeller fold protein YncE
VFGFAAVNPFLTENPARQEITASWRQRGTVSQRATIGGWTALAEEFGGWSIGVHHAYDPAAQVLFLGTGTRNDHWPTITSVVGQSYFGSTADGIPAGQVDMTQPSGVAVAPDGTIYFADVQQHRVRRVTPDGIVMTVAGTGIECWGTCGDGGLAIRAGLAEPEGLALGPDGSLYIADHDNSRVGKDKDGNIKVKPKSGCGPGEPTGYNINIITSSSASAAAPKDHRSTG